MNKFVKKIFLTVCKLLGVYVVFRMMNRKKLLVLTYHGISSPSEENKNIFEYRNCVNTDQFKKQIDFMLQHYKILRNSNWSIDDSRNLAVDNTFIITFDDGFLNNYSLAFPILRLKEVPAIFFITTGFIDNQDLLWTEKIIYFLMNTNNQSITVTIPHPIKFSLSTAKEKETSCQVIRKYLKKSAKSEINKVLSELSQQISDVSLEEAPSERYAFMTWDQIKEMSENGMLIGSHTDSHMILSTMNMSNVEDELRISKSKIEDVIEKKCTLFSYPNGAKNDFNEDHKYMLKKLGYKYVFSQIPGFNTNTTDPYEINRLNITNEMDLTAFEATVSGFLPFLKKCISKWRK